MNQTVTWTFSTEWSEKVEKGRTIVFGQLCEFGNETEAFAAWRSAARLGWLEPHQFDGHVSAMSRVLWDVEDGQRTKQRNRKLIAEVEDMAVKERSA